MRITGGKFCSRNLKVPKTDTIRPTQDRVRAALFNILAPEIADAEFLDLFAGSGAVGLEALSRGAKHATLVEQDPRHLLILKDNITALGVAANTEVIRADVYRWLANYIGAGFTMGFADPPYALGEAQGYAQVLHILANRGIIRLKGLFVAEMTATQAAESTPEWELLRDRLYGKTRLCIWRRIA